MIGTKARNQPDLKKALVQLYLFHCLIVRSHERNGTSQPYDRRRGWHDAAIF
ncbi:hypothetical protein A943_05185 [Bacillus sp. CPSM8]|nr:hypothetical protein A943_05185 [Bacillus sp. CPSM8]TWK09781.1 hypothetical protein CHCC20442_4568 [Bacillus licheniformis]